MIFRQFLSVLISVCLSFTSFVSTATAQQSASLPDGVTKVTSLGGITEYRIKNGLQVLLIPDRTRQNIMVNVVYRVGSRHEGYGETGMAHLLEHLVFKGTPKYANIPGEMSKRGMAPNGTTSFDRTNYFATFPATGDNLEFYLDMEADRMVNSYIAKKDLDSEFSVVRNEMESGENNPQRILVNKLMATAYQWHNYGKSTIGARSDIENVKIENLQAFYRKYYQPDNATVVVGGKIDEAKTLELINQKFGVIPKPSRVLEPTWTVDPPQDGEREIIVRRIAEALKIAAEILKEPAFPDAEFDKARTAQIAALEAQRSEPQAIALREMRRIYSNAKKGDVRYVPTLDEEIADIKAVTLEAVRKFHKDFYGASNAELSIVGDFDEKEITPVINQLFGSWKSPKPYTRIPQEFYEPAAAKKTFETPDKANAFFLARQNLKMSDSHPDYPALAIANYIFGGGFLNSRLATRLRQKEGFSYSVASSFSAGSQDEIATFSPLAIFAPENGEKLEKAFYEELSKALTEGFTETELKEAKQGWLLGRQRSRGDDAALRSTLVNYLNLNRTFAWDDELERKVQALTLEQVNAAFKKHINPEKLSVFKAGDFAKVKK